MSFNCNTVWFQNVEQGEPVLKKRRVHHKLNIRQRNHIEATISKSGNESITRSNCFQALENAVEQFLHKVFEQSLTRWNSKFLALFPPNSPMKHIVLPIFSSQLPKIFQ